MNSVERGLSCVRGMAQSESLPLTGYANWKIEIFLELLMTMPARWCCGGPEPLVRYGDAGEVHAEPSCWWFCDMWAAVVIAGHVSVGRVII